MTPLLGEGIFTTDGAAWQHSRDMLRPNFVRTQIGDIDMFEKHVQNVIRAIPRDGSVINLHDLFFNMSLDIATEFLFGESTGILRDEKVDARTERFVKALTYAQEAMDGSDGEWSILGMFLPNWRLKSWHKIVHGKSALVHLPFHIIPSRQQTRPYPYSRVVSNRLRRLTRRRSPPQSIKIRRRKIEPERRHPPLHLPPRTLLPNQPHTQNSRRTSQHSPRRPRHYRLPPHKCLVPNL